MSAEGSSKLKKGKGHGHGHKHADVTCWNCEEKGHISCNCKKLKTSKMKDNSGKQGGNGKASRSGSGNANVVEKVNSDEEEGAWAAEEEELDWFDEVVEAIEGEGRKDAMIEDFGDTSGEAFIVTKAVKLSGTAELYNSGCTNHISPYHD